MGMMGRRKQSYADAGIAPPSIGSRVLNQIGMNLLGVDFEKQRLRDAMAGKQREFMDEFTSKLGPQYEAGPDINVSLDPAESNASTWEYKAPQKTSDGLSIMSPELPALAAQAQRLGVPLNTVLDVLKAQSPDIASENGFLFNKKDVSNAGRYLPKLGDGEEPLYDGKGNVVAVRNLDGSVRAAAERAGAVKGAEAAAQAPYELVQVQGADGTPIFMTKAQMAQRSASAQGGGAGGGAGGFLSTGQSPQAKLEAEATAQRRVDRPVIQARMRSMDHLTDIALTNIDKALSKISPISSGLIGGYTSGIPGTPAADLKAVLDSIGGSISVDQLQTMRANNTTGGALGNVTERELDLLSSLLSAIRNTQSPDQLVQNLTEIKKGLSEVKQLRERAFSETYGSEQRPAASSAPRGPRTSGYRSRIISVQ